jgi:ferredoxin
MTEGTTRPFLSERARLGWRAAQVAVWLIGVAIFVLLIARPPLGLDAFWNVLIPVAPALFVFAPGIWRNVCPLASTALFARHNDAKPRAIMSQKAAGAFSLAGLVLLLVIVPMRHVIFDTSGPATAILLASAAVVAVAICRVFEWKSAWCSGLCPVHPVEKLYGQRPAISPANAHCHACHRCVRVCPDSTPAVSPLLAPASRMDKWAGIIFVGGFAGFVWGWFQTPDFQGGLGWASFTTAFALPMAGLGLSLAVFIAVRRVIAVKYHPALTRVFASAAVAVYYWYRIPGLVGFGPIPSDGMLVDLSGTLPAWTVAISRAGTTALFAWWLVFRSNGKRAWTVRPPFSDTTGTVGASRVVPLTVAQTALATDYGKGLPTAGSGV